MNEPQDEERWISLADALKRLAGEPYNLRARASNLQMSRGRKPSYMKQLEAAGLARKVNHGKRNWWEVRQGAVDHLATMIATRPGPRTVEVQATLSAAQLRPFAQHLLSADDPPSAVRAAAAAALGVPESTLATLVRVIVPTEPRRSREDPPAGDTTQR